MFIISSEALSRNYTTVTPSGRGDVNKEQMETGAKNETVRKNENCRKNGTYK